MRALESLFKRDSRVSVKTFRIGAQVRVTVFCNDVSVDLRDRRRLGGQPHRSVLCPLHPAAKGPTQRPARQRSLHAPAGRAGHRHAVGRRFAAPVATCKCTRILPF